MGVVARCLVQAKYAGSSATSEYITNTSARAIIDKFTATNDSGSAATLTVNIIPSGGTLGGSNVITKAVSIAAGASLSLADMAGQVLNGGDILNVVASSGSAIVIRVSGREVT